MIDSSVESIEKKIKECQEKVFSIMNTNKQYFEDGEEDEVIKLRKQIRNLQNLLEIAKTK